MSGANDRKPKGARAPLLRTTLLAFALTLAGIAASTSSCVGDIGDTATAGAGASGPGEGIQTVTHSRFPRLSHRQWENTVQDLLRLDKPTGFSSAFYPDPLGGKVFDNNESVLQVTPQLWADYETAAEKVASLVMDDAAKLAKILPADLPTDAAKKKAAFLDDFGKRAFRRPLTAGEVKALSAKFDQGPSLDSKHDAFTAGVGLVIETMLQSPFFLYRAELSTAVDPQDGLIHLTGFELATKLSYTLWNTMPDEALFAAAEGGKLESAADLKSMIGKMLKDPRSAANFVSFHHQLYQVDQYPQMPAKDPTMFPDFDPLVIADMETELDMFVKHVVVEQGGGLKKLLTSTTTFVNLRLAEIYGLDTKGRTNDKFEQVELDPKQRSGLLTRAGFLAWKGRSADPDTILRGVFINRLVLCQELGNPPAAAAGAMLGNQATDRERVNALTGKGTCAETCHYHFIDPVGYAFENYDAIGGYRTKDNGHPVDAASAFPFDGKLESYKNASEFASLTAASDQANSCYARYWLQFAFGRDLQPEDQPQVDALASLSQGGGSARDLIVELLTSPSFTTRTTKPEDGQ
jgi:hypothetical protein